MGNTTAHMRQSKELDSSESPTMGGPSDSEYVTALATEAEQAATSISAFFSARSEAMMAMIKKSESGKCRSIEEQIECSKSHWSELVESDSDDDEVAEISNVAVFKALQMHPTWGDFFQIFGEDGEGDLVMGMKFAEGGQAELYEAQIKYHNPQKREYFQKHPREYVLKVFKEGTLLRRLQSQWPQGMLKYHAEKIERIKRNMPLSVRYSCRVARGTLLKDGRFAFLMEREQADLRALIDQNMLTSAHDCGPFSKEVAESIMYRVALGMDWLHTRNIVHRDLKASNVLYTVYEDDWACFVADFECSVGVIGTGFFRAPEILQACKDGNASRRPDLFTKEADVYSYGMTCYEILTGKLPFEGHSLRNYDLVLGGQRPEVPHYVDGWARELLNKCWQSNPAARPTFGEILTFLEANSAAAEFIRRCILEVVAADIRPREQVEQRQHVFAKASTN